MACAIKGTVSLFSKYRHVRSEKFLKIAVRNFSTEVGTRIEQPVYFENPNFRCDVSDPREINSDHLAQYYKLNDPDKNRIFNLGGLPKTFTELCESFNETCIMIRNPALETIKLLKNLNSNDPLMKCVLYGREGAGKSLTLAHIIHHCDYENWIIIHAPWIPLWTKRTREATPSLSFKNKRDLPVLSAVWLQHFSIQNAQKLKDLDIRTSKTYSWSKREETPAGQPILDIVEHGVNRMKHSTDCVFAILEEISNYSKQGKFKTLVALDGVNAFYETTRLLKEFKVRLEPDEISLICAFKELILSDSRNGAIVATVDKLATAERTNLYLPKELLRKEGFTAFEPFVPIHVPYYNRKEVSSCLDYYIDRNWIQNEKGQTAEGKSELAFLSGYCPYSLMKICSSL